MQVQSEDMQYGYGRFGCLRMFRLIFALVGSPSSHEVFRHGHHRRKQAYLAVDVRFVFWFGGEQLLLIMGENNVYYIIVLLENHRLSVD